MSTINHGRRYQLGVAALGLLALAQPVLAQSPAWPQRPIKLIVPFAAGGNTDGIARLTAERLSQSLGQTVIVENKAGANGAIAADFVAQSPPDGYTLFMAAMPVLAILPTITKTKFDPLRDFVPVSNVGSNPFVMAISSSVPAKNVREFVAYAKKNDGKLNFASGGSGSVSHLSPVLFLKRANINMTHISYKGGGPAVADLLGGQVQMYFGNLSELAPHADGGKIRIIGVSSLERAKQIPDVPTLAESGYPGFKTLTWNGIVAPTGTPPAIINKVAAAVQSAVSKPEMRARLWQLGVDPIGDTPAQFSQTLKADITTWAEAAKASNLKID
ncbi:MAG: tripartite tricarboxylate transporter substrate binding protein [Polaromonas sp.]|uniref:Bug family tripartite tricarboxylate transporter substrate binding protein n=1 Tax=Polaromonas sp. TaxID=1869339 RepID=UPI0025F3543A|nr:tripartite tricarboxylate transporter substrate binding protein [Polaromonas sp.]MBI2727956.1 tripartite tricarboxylate transporter substrate binding protein [Polaromonas sp.]